MGNLVERALSVKREIGKARLVIVSKNAALSQIKELAKAGFVEFGENRMQSAKISALADTPICWHFIGHLQTNKVKEAVKHFSLIHSVDSLKLMREIDKRAREIGKIQEILLQVKPCGLKPAASEALDALGGSCNADEKGALLCNLKNAASAHPQGFVNVSGEESKGGFANKEEVMEAVAEAGRFGIAGGASKAIAEAGGMRTWKDADKAIANEGTGMKNVKILGLMTIAPHIEAERTRECFAKLRKMRNEIAGELKISLPELSMGMTNDYAVAVEEGSTIVRIGRKIIEEKRA